MNLGEIIDLKHGLQQDEWSQTEPTFDDGRLTVLGWSGKRKYCKMYIVRCSVCAEDNELFGEGYFKSPKGDLLRGQIPCGCSKKVIKTKEQYAILCKRAARKMGYDFINFIGEWRGRKTNVEIYCSKHGVWSTAIIQSLVSEASGCPDCGRDRTRDASIKPDSEMIASFFASGGFHPDTKFWRSDRKDNKGWQSYWNVFCPECNENGESFSGNLRAGKRCCGCSEKRQKYAYINFVYDNNLVVALKFGITNKVNRRVSQQNKRSRFLVENKYIYQFYSVAQCKKAELECLQQLETCVLSRQEMPDGWTETTWSYNLEKIIEIYERNGGIHICSDTNRQ